MSEHRFWFVRHGETEPNRAGVRCGGDADAPLTPLGEATARELGAALQKYGIELILTSPLARTRRTAEIIREQLGDVPIEIDADLIERHLGEWNGRSIAETETWLKLGHTPPGGEAASVFAARVLNALDRIRAQLPKRILVVSSKGVARVFNEALGDANRPAAANGELIEYALRGG